MSQPLQCELYLQYIKAEREEVYQILPQKVYTQLMYELKSCNAILLNEDSVLTLWAWYVQKNKYIVVELC